jgi:hypothetical protein
MIPSIVISEYYAAALATTVKTTLATSLSGFNLEKVFRISYLPIYPSDCALCLSQFSKYSLASSLDRIISKFSAAARVKLKLPMITTSR